MVGKKYKRKFLISGKTPHKNEFYEKYCNKCEKGKTPYPNNCYGIGDLYPPFSKCIHKEHLYSKYIVSETEDGHWECSCKGWIFKYKKTGGECDHIKEVKANPEKYEIPIETTSGTIKTFKELLG